MGRADYYSNVRLDILPLLEKKADARLLEIGCGKGYTLAYLKKKGYASYVAGVEKVCFEPKEGDPDNIDKMINGDAEDLELKFSEKFDAILLLDVLEHLYDPMAFIKRVGKVLKPNGYILLSVPNIRNWSILKKLLLRGRWDYKDSGILDRTHIRFFTKRSFMISLNKEVPGMRVVSHSANKERHGHILRHLPWFKDLFICQLLFKLKLKE